jgi:hypothetical protein
MALYQVTVGNIGKVIDTDNLKEAREGFEFYKQESIRGVGRAGGEPVVFWAGDDPTREHDPDVYRLDLCEARVNIETAKLALARARIKEHRLLSHDQPGAGDGHGVNYRQALADEQDALRQQTYAKEQLAVAIEEASRDN